MLSFKNIYFLFIVIFSGLSCSFYRSQEGLIFAFLLSLFCLFIWHIKPDKRFFTAIAIWLLYAFMGYLKWNEFFPFFIFKNIAIITIAFCVIHQFKDTLFYKFEKVIYYLSLLSLVFYGWQLINPESLLSIMKTVDISQGAFSHRPNYYNALFITIDYYPETFLQRNSGFCWEPGPFSIYIIIALMFNLIRNHYRMLDNRIFWVLIITLFTTQSTTGFSALFLMFFFIFIFEKKMPARKVLFPVFAAIIITASFQLDFMFNKVAGLFQKGYELQDYLDVSAETGQSYSAGRFGGTIIAWKDFMNNPLLGLAGKDEESFGRQNFSYVYIVNGLGVILSHYGSFGILLFLYCVKRSSFFYAKYFQMKNSWMFFSIALVFSFGFSIHIQPILFVFLFLSLFENIYRNTIYT